MKVYLILPLLFFMNISFGQNPKKILKKSYDKCQSVKSGYYEMTHSQKYMSREDTVSSTYTCYFKKLEDDTLYASAFHYQAFFEGEYSRDIMYTGEAFVSFDVADSVGRVMDKQMWAEDIDRFSHNYTFYDPLFTRTSSPLPDEEVLNDADNTFAYIGEETYNGQSVHHVQMNYKPDPDTTQMILPIRIEFHFWISKKNNLPLQHTIAYDMVMGGDTMYQYEQIELTAYDLKHPGVEDQIAMEIIPDYIVLEDYVPYERPDPLPLDTIAPDWNLVSLTGDSIRLSDLKGDLVIIDFFYKACFPCMQALPALQSLHEKYADQGLKMVGIDPYDTIEDDKIDEFMAKRGVTYTVLLGGKSAAKQYRVSGYPTLYIVGKEGKVLFMQSGYGKGTEAELEEIILANL